MNPFWFDRNHVSEFDFIDVTEECARQVYPYLGCRDPKKIDEIATNTIRSKLNVLPFYGRVVLCEGKKDDSHGIYGERVGTWYTPMVGIDMASDPVDGSRRSANGQSDACSIMVLAGRDCIYVPKTYYMKKAVISKELKKNFDCDLLDLPVETIAETLGRVLNRRPVISMLKRDRNNPFVEKFNGCSFKFIDDCDVFGSFSVLTGVDLFYGIGGATEAILAVSALKSMRVHVECQEVDDKTFEVASGIFKSEDLIDGESAFIATGITNGQFLRGVKIKGGKIVTHSIFVSNGEWKEVKTSR